MAKGREKEYENEDENYRMRRRMRIIRQFRFDQVVVELVHI